MNTENNERAEVLNFNTKKRDKLTGEIKEILERREKEWRDIADLLIDLEGTFENVVGGTKYTKWCTDHFGANQSILSKYKKARDFELRYSTSNILPFKGFNTIYEISTRKDSDREEIVERIEEGWYPSTKDIRKQYPSKTKTKKIAKKERPVLTKEMQEVVEEEVSRIVSERVSERIRSVQKREQRINKLTRALHRPMEPKEFKKVLSCLHPDSAKNKTDEQLNTAYSILVRKLKPIIDGIDD